MQLEHALRYEMLFGYPVAKDVPALCSSIRNGLWEDITATLRTDAGEHQNSGHKRSLLRAALERLEAITE